MSHCLISMKITVYNMGDFNQDYTADITIFTLSTLQPLYNTVHYNMVLDTKQFKDGSQKYIDYIEKWP